MSKVSTPRPQTADIYPAGGSCSWFLSFNMKGIHAYRNTTAKNDRSTFIFNPLTMLCMVLSLLTDKTIY